MGLYGSGPQTLEAGWGLDKQWKIQSKTKLNKFLKQTKFPRESGRTLGKFENHRRTLSIFCTGLFFLLPNSDFLFYTPISQETITYSKSTVTPTHRLTCKKLSAKTGGDKMMGEKSV